MSKEVSFSQYPSLTYPKLTQKTQRGRVQTAKPVISRYPDASQFLASRRKRAHSMQASMNNINTEETITEINNLIKTTERDARDIFITTRLSNYRLLHDIINLRRNPIDFPTLAKLQKRENLIIQMNAVKDERYIDLVTNLQPRKTDIRRVANKPIIYNVYQECELHANRYLNELRASNGLKFSHIEAVEIPVVF